MRLSSPHQPRHVGQEYKKGSVIDLLIEFTPEHRAFWYGYDQKPLVRAFDLDLIPDTIRLEGAFQPSIEFCRGIGLANDPRRPEPNVMDRVFYRNGFEINHRLYFNPLFTPLGFVWAMGIFEDDEAATEHIMKSMPPLEVLFPLTIERKKRCDSADTH